MSIPLENDGGSGTAGSHWDEVNFAPNGEQMSNELMTGWLNKNEQTYLSDTTIGALAVSAITFKIPRSVAAIW